MAVWNSDSSRGEGKTRIGGRIALALASVVSMVVIPAAALLLYRSYEQPVQLQSSAPDPVPQPKSDTTLRVRPVNGDLTYSQKISPEGLPDPNLFRTEFAPGGIQNFRDCVVALDDYLTQLIIYFDSNSAVLRSQYEATLLEIAEQVANCPEAEIYVYGHTDVEGTDRANHNMSWARAESVVEHVASNGYDTSQYRLHGQSARELRQEGDTPDERAQSNRRVQMEAHRRRDRN